MLLLSVFSTTFIPLSLLETWSGFQPCSWRWRSRAAHEQ